MAVPEVSRRLLGELEEMGFPLAHATRALHSSGNSNLDAAVDWLFEHENNAEIDQMPLVLVNIDVESLDSSQLTEAVKLKAVELSERACIKKAYEDKKLLTEMEKESKREEKQLLDVKRTKEENERIRFLTKRKAEEEVLKSDRRRIQQKLQQDKAERRRRYGLPMVEPSTAKHEAASRLEKKGSYFDMSANTLGPANKVELMRECLRSLKINPLYDGFTIRMAFQTLMIYVKNVVKNPHEEKFRKIRLDNQTFQEKVGNMEEGIRFLQLCGFERDGKGKFLFLPADKVDLTALVSAGNVLNSAITNPYFGILSK